jgi:hypothetical protein
MSTLSDDALATLTPEEQEAIKGDDYNADELAAMQKLASDVPDDDDDADDDDDGNEGSTTDQSSAAPIEGKAAEVAAKPGAESQAGAVDDTSAAPGNTQASAPRYDAALPADYEAKVSELTQREAELKRAFRAGELEFDDFETQRDELLRDREALTIARAKAEISQEMQQQTAAQQWRTTIDRFMDGAKAAIDYRADTAKAGDLDAFVRHLGQQEANADKPMEWFLVEAHKRVLALHGMPQAQVASGTPAAPAQPTAVAEATARRRPPVSAVPATLAQVPGSDGPGDVAGEFADVLALDGMEYETAIARMTPAQREKFLRAA